MSENIATVDKRAKAEFDNSRVMKWITFGAIYFVGFSMIEKRVSRFHIVYTELDGMIPFCEYFVVPYLLWFVYTFVTIAFFCLKNRKEEENIRLLRSFVFGAVIFFAMSLFYPNIQYLRPAVVGNNVFGRLVKLVYSMDTPTNILPSLHVYISVVCFVAIAKNETCRARKGLVPATFILTVLIILSTMFLKQHSVIDVVMALGINWIAYRLIYRRDKSRKANIIRLKMKSMYL